MPRPIPSLRAVLSEPEGRERQVKEPFVFMNIPENAKQGVFKLSYKAIFFAFGKTAEAHILCEEHFFHVITRLNLFAQGLSL